ncbi:MAG: OsmC family protein [Acidimicrobiales bacterium]|nr:OsmC family protein [Acidimicrobiales bacterium]
MSITETPTADNGVNVEALLGAKEHVAAEPALAAFVWKASSEWVNGAHTRSTIEKFHGLQGEQSHREAYELETDHPELFAATDNGVTPVEMVLAGLAGCLTAGVASVAQNRGIQLRSVTAELGGSMDIRGILGADRDVRNGFDGITVTFTVDADASAEDIAKLVAQSQKRSAVFDVIANETPIAIEVAS